MLWLVGFSRGVHQSSGTDALDWCDDELFRRVKDTLTVGEFVAIVVSPLRIAHFGERFVGALDPMCMV